MQKLAFSCNKFSGINRTNSIFSSSIITASDCQNIELFSSEVNSGIGIRTSKGNTSICNKIPKDEIIINIFESIQKGKTYFFVYTENKLEGKIYLYSPSTKELILKVSKLSITGKACATDVAQGWSDLWVFSNSKDLLSIELNHYTEEGNLSEIKRLNLQDRDGRKIQGLGLFIYAGRLWIFNNHILWYSVQENIYDFSTSNTQVNTSAGYIEFIKNITAIYPYLDSLAVFHKDSSSLITKDENFNFSKTMEFPGGCASYNSVVFHGTELYFYDHTKKGIFSFKQMINGDRTLGENIALDIQEELFQIEEKSINQIKVLSIVTSDKNEVWFLIPTRDEKYSTIMIYDYIHRCWLKRKSQKITCIAIIGGTLYSAGKKIYEEYNSNTFDEEYIESYYKCTPLNFGKENSIKILSSSPKITVDMNYRNLFYINYTKNYNNLTSKTRLIKCNSLKNYLYFDIGNWDNSYFARKEINSLKRLPTSYFKTLQITFLTRHANNDFCIKNIEFEKIKMKTL